ncbi:DUF2510 domain-containing protein [Leifsonia sp. LS-T14]|uniref:DUF2510 domain-containing protein n=1 Tax=unclassified Leifsonia TaxID=2663824 RepID=UPI0035A6CD63
MSDAALPVAGWYEDPAGGGGVRWWDGSTWTQHARPREVEAAPEAAPDSAGSPQGRHRSPVAAPPAPVAPQPAQQLVLQPTHQPAQQPAQQPAFQPIAPLPIHQPAYPPAYSPVAPLGKAPYGGGLYNPSWDAYHGRNSAAAWSLALGILSAALLLLSEVLGYAPGLPGIGAVIWGIVGISRSRRIGVGRTRSIWGLSLGVVSLIAALIIHFVLMAAILGPHYDRAALENSIVRTFASQAQRTVTAVCPESPPLTVGSTFQCTATESTGATHPVIVTVEDDKGSMNWSVRQ